MIAEVSETVSTTKPSIVSPSWTSLLLIMQERVPVPPDMMPWSFGGWAARLATARSSVGSWALGVTRKDPPAGGTAAVAREVVGRKGSAGSVLLPLMAAAALAGAASPVGR